MKVKGSEVITVDLTIESDQGIVGIDGMADGPGEIDANRTFHGAGGPSPSSFNSIMNSQNSGNKPSYANKPISFGQVSNRNAYNILL